MPGDFGALGRGVILESSVKLRLSVWRDFVPSKSLIFRQSAGQEHHLLDSDVHLQQEVYSWQTREDIFAGVSDEKIRSGLHEKLFGKFEPSRPPSDRRAAALREFIDDAGKVIRDKASEWTTSQDPPSEDVMSPFALNSLLALKLQLEWLVDVFADQPGISVSLR
jgi:hypothetical protein